jgi:hypothetical protein
MPDTISKYRRKMNTRNSASEAEKMDLFSIPAIAKWWWTKHTYRKIQN